MRCLETMTCQAPARFTVVEPWLESSPHEYPTVCARHLAFATARVANAVSDGRSPVDLTVKVYA